MHKLSNHTHLMACKNVLERYKIKCL